MVCSPDVTAMALPISPPEVAYSVPPTPPTAAAFPQPHLAYLPSLSQPSFLMLYGAPTSEGPQASEGQGQRSPRAAEAREKRKSVDEEMELNPPSKRERCEEERQVSVINASISNLAPGWAQATDRLMFAFYGKVHQGARRNPLNRTYNHSASVCWSPR